MTDNIEDLAADIRAVDGDHKLGAGELAEKLVEKGWGKTNLDTTPEYPRTEGDTTVLGPEIFTGNKGAVGFGVISWKGENYYLPSAMPAVKSSPAAFALKDYKMGDKVEVLKDGDRIPGHITSIDKVSHWLHVHTERGPVTIASTHAIRRL